MVETEHSTTKFFKPVFKTSLNAFWTNGVGCVPGSFGLPINILEIISTCLCAKSLQSCPSLCYPADFSPPRSLCPWDCPGKNTGVGCHGLLQGIFPTQGSNPRLLRLLHCRQILYCWAPGKVQSLLVLAPTPAVEINLDQLCRIFQSRVCHSMCSQSREIPNECRQSVFIFSQDPN